MKKYLCLYDEKSLIDCDILFYHKIKILRKFLHKIIYSSSTPIINNLSINKIGKFIYKISFRDMLIPNNKNVLLTLSNEGKKEFKQLFLNFVSKMNNELTLFSKINNLHIHDFQQKIKTLVKKG